MNLSQPTEYRVDLGSGFGFFPPENPKAFHGMRGEKDRDRCRIFARIPLHEKIDPQILEHTLVLKSLFSTCELSEISQK